MSTQNVEFDFKPEWQLCEISDQLIVTVASAPTPAEARRLAAEKPGTIVVLRSWRRRDPREVF